MAVWGLYVLAFWFVTLMLTVFSLITQNAYGGLSLNTVLGIGVVGSSGILELWLHEVIRAAPMLVPSAGAVWGFLSAFTMYSVFTAFGGFEANQLLFFTIQPFLAVNVLAHVILIKHSISTARTFWSFRETEPDARIEALRDMVRPTIIAFGVAAGLLFVSALIVYVATGDQYNPAVMHMDMVSEDGMIRMAELVYHIVSVAWTEPDWDQIQNALV